ncbi:MAG: hypothetical protein U0Q15_01180 [Kineosporiaceae bacterium]
MRFRVSRSLLALRLTSFLVLPLVVWWVGLLTLDMGPAAYAIGVLFSLPAVAYALISLRFSVTLDRDVLVVRALGAHSIPASSIRAVSIRQRGLRLMVLVDTVRHGWIPLPAPLALAFWGRERFERQHQAITDWWEASRRG